MVAPDDNPPEEDDEEEEEVRVDHKKRLRAKTKAKFVKYEECVISPNQTNINTHTHAPHTTLTTAARQGGGGSPSSR